MARSSRIPAGYAALPLMAAFGLLLPLLVPTGALCGDIVVVHDKGLPRSYMNTKRDMRENRYDRNSFFYVIDLDTGRIVRKYPTRYGINEGDKEHEGDRRTPVGKYWVQGVSPRGCDTNFGPFCIPIDYPNRFDEKRRYPGSDITIHGGPERNTLGCIRLLDNGHEHLIDYQCPGSPWNHVKAIYEFGTTFCEYGRASPPLLSFSSLDRRYRGREGERLSEEAIAFYRGLLSRSDLDNDTIDALGACIEDFPQLALVVPRSCATACASSSLGNFYDIAYDPRNVLDGDPSTAWVEGASGDGTEESLRINLPEKQKVTGISILNGYQKQVGSQDRWAQNNRVKRLLVEFSDNQSYFLDLTDSRAWQRFEFRAPVETRYVNMIIKEVYHGSKWDDDTCISEVRIE